MDKVYNHKDIEEKIYQNWEEKGYFKPEVNPDGKPYSIILPPPNANGDLHFGHAMFVIEDILVRFHRMKGFSTLWLPGTDHAGTETQFVFEKKLQAEGKSRFDFSREELYQQIWDYVAKNRGGIENQLKRLGFSLDWSREKFTLDKDIVEIVKGTFRKMFDDGLVYRDYRLVNYCTRDGTSFSDLETVSEEGEGILYHVKYPVKDGGEIVIATTRPETMYGDVAVMVNPNDSRYKELIGKTAVLPIVDREIPIIADDYVDQNFGTGAVKVTPSHDFNDFEVGRRHNLTLPPIIGWSGKFEKTGVVDGLYVKQAREETVKRLKEVNLIIKEVPHKMVIKKCYKCKTVLEPLPLEQWYVKVKPLIENAEKAVDAGFVKIYPQNFVQTLNQWYAGLRDWNISRQNVWGIQIPVWYEAENEAWFAVSYIDKDQKMHQGTLKQLLEEGHKFDEILKGLQRVIALMEANPVFEDQKEAGKRYLPETDTFDTWFSSGQWPYVTLKTTKEGDFEKFYPTSVMETGYDILRAWVSRMLILGLYVANGKHITDEQVLKETVPFKNVVLHGLVNDPLGKKMSKSKGNVVNPLQIADEYGADAVRMALVYGTGLGNDQAMSYAKLDSAKKFANKLWNMARFIEIQKEKVESVKEASYLMFPDIDTWSKQNADSKDIEWVEKVKILSKEITKYLENYQFNLAAERLYEFMWHEFADIYIEDVKNRINSSSFAVLNMLFIAQLKLLHPFMPFITEEIYQKLGGESSIMISQWPTAK